MVRPARILVTGAGAPGIAGTIHAIRDNPDGRPARIVGTDIDRDAVGQHLADAFAVVPPPEDADYLDAMLHVCHREEVDVLLPQTTREIGVLARHRGAFEESGIGVAVSDPAALDEANDKHRLLERFRTLGLPHPGFRLAATEDELVAHVEALGYPDAPVVVKPPVSNGMRGLRILRQRAWNADRFLREKPGGMECSLEELLAILRRGTMWPALVVTEFLPGPEYTVDAFVGERGAIAVPRLRRSIRSGISFDAVVEWREDLNDYTLTAARAVGLRYAFGFQFKLDEDGTPKVLECNPRVQGTMVATAFAGVNCVWLAVLEALGERPAIPEPDQVTTRFQRYWGGVGIVAGTPRARL